MLVNRAGKSYKVTGLEVKDSLGLQDAPPSMTGATLLAQVLDLAVRPTQPHSRITSGEPAATQTMKAKVTGALAVLGETSDYYSAEELVIIPVVEAASHVFTSEVLLKSLMARLEPLQSLGLQEQLVLLTAQRLSLAHH